MDVRVERFDPTPPPIQRVIIELSPMEARNIELLFGHLSRDKVRGIFKFPAKGEDEKKDSIVEDIFHLTAGIYNELYYERENKGND